MCNINNASTFFIIVPAHNGTANKKIIKGKVTDTDIHPFPPKIQNVDPTLTRVCKDVGVFSLNNSKRWAPLLPSLLLQPEQVWALSRNCFCTRGKM